MRVRWSAQALGEIEAVIESVAQDKPAAAVKLAVRIFDAVETILADNPMARRPGRVADTRELIVPASCIVAYQVGDTTVDILTYRHAARLLPEEL